MRRSLCIAAAALACSAAWAGGGPAPGTYEGAGAWRGMDGSSGEYTTRFVVGLDRITVEAEYEREGRPHTERHTVKLQSKGEGFFDLVDEGGTTVGRLACLGDECMFGVRQEGVEVAETWRIAGSRIEKFGSKQIGEFHVVWKEILHAN